MADRELAEAKSQLPSEMQDCVIRFLRCPVGHGRLTANNWVDTGCHWCRIAELESKLAKKGLEVDGLRNPEWPEVVHHLIVLMNTEEGRALVRYQQLTEEKLTEANIEIARLQDLPKSR